MSTPLEGEFAMNDTFGITRDGPVYNRRTILLHLCFESRLEI